MGGPEAIVQQVWQRVVPTDWKIIRGKRRSAFAQGGSAALWTCAGLILLALALLALSAWRHAAQAHRSSPSLADVLAVGSVRLDGYPALLVAGCTVTALTPLVGIIVVIIVAISKAGDPDPLIVLLPQGFVEYANRRHPIIGILYADLVSVDFNRQARRRARNWLDLVYLDGHKERWRPRANFGPPQHLFETITKAHALYEVLYGGR